MPKETIAVGLVDNGKGKFRRALNVQWLQPGTVPEAPEGWTNQGYVQIAIHDDSDVCVYTGVELNEEELDHLIRAAKRAKRKVFPRLKRHDPLPTHRFPCIDGDVCGEPAHCPPLSDAERSLLNSERYPLSELPRISPTDEIRLDGLTMAEYMSLSPKVRNVLVGIPEGEPVTDQSYRAIFLELANRKTLKG